MGAALEPKHDFAWRQTTIGDRIITIIVEGVNLHSGGFVTINSVVIEGEVLDALRTCFDPEIPVNIYDSGLVYEVYVDDACAVTIKMTLTSPHCPAVQS